MKKFIVPTSILVLFLAAGSVAGQSYLDEVARAKATSFSQEYIQVSRIDLGRAACGKNELAIVVESNSDETLDLLLKWQADPGLSLGVEEGTVAFTLVPGEEQTIGAEYSFRQLSPFARLSVTISIADSISAVANPQAMLFRSRFRLGPGNPEQKYDQSKFKMVSGRHVNLFFLADTLAARDSLTILERREKAIKDIAQLLQLQFNGNIDLYLYPNAEEKIKDTHHRGEGWAFNRIIVEIYNEEVKLDPYHELAHTLSGTLGTPPAIYDEGFAVYATEFLGSDALKYLGASGKKVDQVTAEYLQSGELVSLADLMDDTDIGGDPARAIIAYPEAASFVKFLISNHGNEMFQALFKRTRKSAEPDVIESNRRHLENLAGKSLEQLELDWQMSLK